MSQSRCGIRRDAYRIREGRHRGVKLLLTDGARLPDRGPCMVEEGGQSAGEVRVTGDLVRLGSGSGMDHLQRPYGRREVYWKCGNCGIEKTGVSALNDSAAWCGHARKHRHADTVVALMNADTAHLEGWRDGVPRQERGSHNWLL